MNKDFSYLVDNNRYNPLYSSALLTAPWEEVGNTKVHYIPADVFSNVHGLYKLEDFEDLSLDFSDFESLPYNVLSATYLTIIGNNKITTLSNLKNVTGALFLVGCTSLTTLGDLESVGTVLNIIRCNALSSLPENLQVGEAILISENMKDTLYIPEHLKSKVHITV